MNLRPVSKCAWNWAATIAAEARRLANEFGGAQVATVGRFEVFPNLVNVIAQHVTFTLDLRNTDEAVLQRAEAHMHAFIDSTCAAEQCSVATRTLARFEPVEFDSTMIDRVERIGVALGNTTRRMPSGAGHDAQMLARICPTSMIFVPSVDGLSHNIAEYTKPEHVAAGANVLLHTVLELATA